MARRLAVRPDDVIYTLRRMGAPKSALFGANVAAMIDLKAMRKADKRTLVLPLKTPSAEFPQLFQPRRCRSSRTARPTSRARSAPGHSSTCRSRQARTACSSGTPHYWRAGGHTSTSSRSVDPRSAARINALLTGQVDAVEYVPYPQAKVQMKAGQIRSSNAHGSSIVPIYMAADLDPFKDVRVRQAMRLIADRPGAGRGRAVGLRRRRQRRLRLAPARVQLAPAPAQPGHRQGQVAAQGGRQVRPEITLYSSTVAPACSSRRPPSPSRRRPPASRSRSTTARRAATSAPST